MSVQVRHLRQSQPLPGIRLDIELQCFPRDDPAFRAEVESLAFSIEGSAGASLVLEAALRRTYPGARVAVRDRLADLAPGPSTWYVYRDGQL